MSDAEKKREVLEYLNSGSWLAYTVPKGSKSQIVNKQDNPAFFSERTSRFDYPEAYILNEMIQDGFIEAHTSPWTDGQTQNQRYDLTHFRITDKGREHLKQSQGINPAPNLE